MQFAIQYIKILMKVGAYYGDKTVWVTSAIYGRREQFNALTSVPLK